MSAWLVRDGPPFLVLHSVVLVVGAPSHVKYLPPSRCSMPLRAPKKEAQRSWPNTHNATLVLRVYGTSGLRYTSQLPVLAVEPRSTNLAGRTQTSRPECWPRHGWHTLCETIPACKKPGVMPTAGDTPAPAPAPAPHAATARACAFYARALVEVFR